jgi:hypothetical protein
MADRRLTILAHVVSAIAHPFVVALVLVGAAAARRSTGAETVRVVAIVALFTVVPLAVLMIRQVRAGAWANADASNVSERPILFVVGAAALVLLIAYLVAARPQSSMIRGAVGTLAMLGACAIATRWIKVSLHMAFATFAATTLVLIGSPAGWVLAVLLPALAWSRLVLERHRPVEIACGCAIGLVAGVALVLL